jgi:hypothetical protein
LSQGFFNTIGRLLSVNIARRMAVFNKRAVAPQVTTLAHGT